MTVAETEAQLATLLQYGRIIPVIRIDRIDDAVPLARALVAGGIRLLEITLRTPVGLDAAARIIDAVPDAIVGIGTVTAAEELRRAREIGARFALSPGATPALLSAARDSGIPFFPGVATASEIMMAREAGFSTVKFFPAATAGGIPALRAFAGPFPDMRFCPTGGVTEHNAAEWLRQPNVVAVGGTWLTPPDEMAAGNWTAIRDRAAQACARIATAPAPETGGA